MTTNRSLWRVTLASGPPPILAAPPGAKHPPSNLRGAKKNLIATLPNSEIDSTHWKQSTRQNSNRNKSRLLSFSRITNHDSIRNAVTASGKEGIHPLRRSTREYLSSTCADPSAQAFRVLGLAQRTSRITAFPQEGNTNPRPPARGRLIVSQKPLEIALTPTKQSAVVLPNRRKKVGYSQPR